ncbi:amidohydrolase family protein [Enterovibrio coralii]|uniref:Guanine deaminase n=1 Tax=Enterovibrio coralii TaxID=294935 RepID=A0A135ID88_9GAMM|nr:amidohydrolase family protein [Enterovibrio coralii]KXF83375.1 guanine deaminase [Enterovibrio coralii]
MIDMTRIQFGILADTFHTPVKGELVFQPDFLILVDDCGDISATFTADDAEHSVYVNALRDASKLNIVEKGQFLMPGLVDLHCHAPQWPQAGKGLDLPLYDWLQNYTFPLENRYGDLAFAEPVYQDVARTLLANGTTSAVYFASIHREASELLAKTSLEQGQRAFVGKINMDNPEQCPEYYREPSVEQALADTEAFIQNVRGLKGNEHGLVKPVITPRFVPSCTDTLLRELGKLVQQHDVHMQTHCSESDWARDYALQHYGKSDIEIYAESGLLNNKTVLAHSIFLTDNDVAMLKEFDAGIGHCPLSNMFFANAAMHTRELLDSGVSIGLGSDIAGAPSPSIFRASFDAVTHSSVREDGVDTRLSAGERGVAGSRVSFVEAFWMATAGGGRVLNEKVGVFEKDFHFDALVIKPSAFGNLRIWPTMDTPRDILEKIVSLAQSCDVDKVWVQGKQVK